MHRIMPKHEQRQLFKSLIPVQWEFIQIRLPIDPWGFSFIRFLSFHWDFFLQRTSCSSISSENLQETRTARSIEIRYDFPSNSAKTRICLSFEDGGIREEEKEQLDSLLSSISTQTKAGEYILSKQILSSGEVSYEWPFYPKAEASSVRKYFLIPTFLFPNLFL